MEKKSRGQSSPRHNAESAKRVQAMSQYGVSCEDIAAIIGMEVRDMNNLYDAEIKKGRAIANAAMGKVLFEQAQSGDTKAAVQWMKWKEMQNG